MKTTTKSGFVATLLMAASLLPAFGNNALWRSNVELPGDHFSLEGALELFKKSRSPEEFEQFLNTPETKVNNLDLNGDGDIDYIKVIDRHDANVHAFILQAVVSPSELQDIAVIELEIHGNGKATLQIVGDEDIYGVETIIEPTEEVRINAGISTARTYVNVWNWPTVQYVYDPFYSVYESPWGWYTRPYWWHPWRPVSYVVYRPYWDPYRPYYSVCNTHRVVYAHNFYTPVRRTSVIVQNRYRSDITYTRETRGRDNHYYDPGNNNGRGQERSPGHRSSSTVLAPSSAGRDDNTRSFSGTHDEQPTRSITESSSGQRTEISTTPRVRTYQAPSETHIRSSRSEHENRSSFERPQTHTPSVNTPRDSSTPRTHSESPHRESTPSVSPQRESYHPEPSPAHVERGRPSSEGSQPSASPASPPTRRGRDN